MKIALIQLNAGQNIKRNINKAQKFVERAARSKARFVLLPEVFTYRGPLKTAHHRRKVSETISGQTVTEFRKLAQKLGVHILLGSFYEQAIDDTRLYNTSVLIDQRGQILKKYRKINLFKAEVGDKLVDEGRYFLKGRRAAIAPLDKFTVGLSVCFDLRFPTLYQKCRMRGADVLCVPASFTHITGKAHWKTLLKARAIENQSYVLAPNQIGVDYRGIRYYGHSMVVDPWGQVLAEGSSNQEEIIYATLDRQKINDIRTRVNM